MHKTLSSSARPKDRAALAAFYRCVCHLKRSLVFAVGFLCDSYRLNVEMFCLLSDDERLALTEHRSRGVLLSARDLGSRSALRAPCADCHRVRCLLASLIF